LSGLCRTLSQKVLATPLRDLERVGIARILSALTDDVAAIAWAVSNVPAVAMNLAILAGCAVYLGWLSWPIMLAVFGVLLLGAVAYRVLVYRAFRYLQRARDTRDELFRHFRTLTEGVKELKLHAERRRAFMQERLEPAVEALRRDSLSGLWHHIVASGWSQVLFYAALGALVFTLPRLPGVTTETLTGYLLVTLYMMTPVWGLIDSWPTFARGRIALAKVSDLGVTLSPALADVSEGAIAPGSFEGLELDAVVFAYGENGDNAGFVLGPVDVSLRPGEVVFLVGGNGSGKSTFVKVLTGLYPPSMGALRLNGRIVDDKNRDWYRQHFAAVFSDFYLFDGLLGLGGDDIDGRAQRYLVRLGLEGKLRVEGGRFSTTALSQGQRKRLALLTAFLEDRPIYVFDEWAADQDVHYRDIFYREILPELKSRGKTVVVISHDDRYYHLGDRILKLEYGTLLS
ncbi:MAG TPA: cyclic peptide export ABC transporter, partial [Methylomirabilota bacterium]|nr:cyclic peptide export ABC transporter [Methylomirabilota bacterium]